MNQANNWANPSNASMQDIHEMVIALEERAKTIDQLHVNRTLVDTLAPVIGEHILEVGCGSGVICRQIAPAVVPGGKIMGLDISTEFLKLAQSYVTKTDISSCIQWSAGRAEVLPFHNASFDGVIAARLLLHVSNPQPVLSEMLRVVRPGGRVEVMDWDFETVTLDHSDRELTRRILHWRCDHHGGNNWSGRQLWRRMVSVGFANVKQIPVVSVAYHENDSLTLSLFKAAQVARDDGAIAPNEYDVWVSELRSSLATGCFFASIVYFIVIGERQ